VSRHEVRASVLGEHGQAMVPLWSSVEVLVADRNVRASLQRLEEKAAERPLHERVDALRNEVADHIDAERIPEAYAAVLRALPDARVFVEPFITATCMHSTPNATANATLQCVAAALADDRRRIHGQALLEGEVLDLHAVCGIPITLSRSGWRPEKPESIASAEKQALLTAAASINEYAVEILTPRPAQV
ncbi:MAG: lactate dehydrogenase, partial [Silvibacterium sp.]|nr:lactate dehydrogenase [Silvibacterium sp.]